MATKDFIAEYIQGDNLPEIKIKHDRDMTAFVANVLATAHFPVKIVSSANSSDTSLKINEDFANTLHFYGCGSGIRGRIFSTGEWIKITAVDGINITVERAQDDTKGDPTTAHDIPTGTELTIMPLDDVPLTSEIDTLDSTNHTTKHTLTSAQTRLLPSAYILDINLSDSALTTARIITKKGDLVIYPDSNGV